MTLRKDRPFCDALQPESGRSHRLRYLLHGHRWENDWMADAHRPDGYSGDHAVATA